jgi:hypothetical protein
VTSEIPSPKAQQDTPPAAWLDTQVALFSKHGVAESDGDARLLRAFLSIVSEESARLKLAATDDEARAAALALRKDLALGLIQTPEDGRSLVPSTIEILRRIGLGGAPGR